MDKKKKINIIVGSVIGLFLLLAVSFMPIWGDGEEEVFTTSIPTLSQDEDFSIDDMTNFNSDEDYKVEDQQLNYDNNSKAQSLLDKINNASKVDSTNSIYDNESNPNVQLLEQQIKNLAEKEAALNLLKNIPTKDPKISAQEMELERIKRLREARASYNKQQSSNSNRKGILLAEIKTVIYDDQYVIPGQQAVLALFEDTTINGITYKRGKEIYAYVTINETRALLDIKKIGTEAFKIVVEDGKDRLEGLNSPKVPHLWELFQNDQKEGATDEVASEINANTRIPIIGSAIQGLSTFFQNKTIKKNEKILLHNGHVVYLKIY